MNRLLLWSVARLAPVWQRLGADPRALRLILPSKMKIGDRSLKVMGQTQGKASNYAILIYLFLLLFGGFFLILYIASDDKATGIGLIFTFISVYLGFMLVTEMSETLFDTRDLTLLYSRPVSDATLSLSRGLYIYLFASKFVLPLTVPLVESYGMDLIWFGVVVIKLLEIGLITPPVGLNVFVIANVVGREAPIDRIFAGIARFLSVDVIVLVLIMAFPAISLILPMSMR